MLSTRQLYRSNNQPASYAALTQFAPEPSKDRRTRYPRTGDLHYRFSIPPHKGDRIQFIPVLPSSAILFATEPTAAISFFNGWRPGGTGALRHSVPDFSFFHRIQRAKAWAVGHRDVEDIVALDVALRRNDRNWVEKLPDDAEKPIIHKLYYGHFFCHVFHQDYIIRKGHNPMQVEHRMWKLLDTRQAEYPAEHNVGHLYEAKPALASQLPQPRSL
jgi:D-lactate dehydrogenase, membrane binding